jgi:hypothetical protein
VEQLTADEVATLEQFVTRRGGSVVALLDRPPTGAIRRLLPFSISERRESQPVQAGPLKMSDFLTITSADSLSMPLVSAGNDAVIVSTPIGNGRVIVSGASDAWRHRQDNAFNAFWQSLIADAADATGDALVVTLDKQLARPHERVRMDAEWRPLRGIGNTIDARAALVCAKTSQPIRLWPNGAPGRFDGELVAPESGECRVAVTLNNATGSAPLLVRDVPTVAAATGDELSTAIKAHGGTAVNAGDEATLIAALRRSASPRDISTQIHPTRSPLWIVPFAAFLGGEWLLRRRGGRR